MNRTYEELAKHYGTALLPARPRKPRDKAKVEVAVQVAQRWILARLRNEIFFSLEELNARIWELLEELNARPMRHLGGVSRRELYEQVDRPQLKALPDAHFEYSEWSRVRANLDYHVEFDRHYYSVHYTLARAELEVRATATTVEIFRVGNREATHPRSYEPYKHTTLSEHMPKAHQRHRDWQPSLLVEWARRVGPMTAALVERIITSRRHPEQGYRSCKGLQRMGAKYGTERLEAACHRALLAGACSYHPVSEILRRGLDRLDLEQHDASRRAAPIDHENVRGPDYYH
jgi:transposase